MRTSKILTVEYPAACGGDLLLLANRVWLVHLLTVQTIAGGKRKPDCSGWHVHRLTAFDGHVLYMLSTLQ